MNEHLSSQVFLPANVGNFYCVLGSSRLHNTNQQFGIEGKTYSIVGDVKIPEVKILVKYLPSLTIVIVL